MGEDLLAGRYRWAEPAEATGTGRRAWDERAYCEVVVDRAVPPPGQDRTDASGWKARAVHGVGVVAGLRHPGIAPIRECFSDGDGVWIVREAVSGRTLAQVVADAGGLPVDAAGRLGAEIADVLAAVHEAGVVHGSLGPASVLLTEDRAVLTGFGTAAASPGSDAAEDLRALGATLAYALGGDSYLPGAEAGPLFAVVHDLLSGDPERRPAATRAAALFRGDTAPPPPSSWAAPSEPLSPPAQAAPPPGPPMPPQPVGAPVPARQGRGITRRALLTGTGIGVGVGVLGLTGLVTVRQGLTSLGQAVTALRAPKPARTLTYPGVEWLEGFGFSPDSAHLVIGVDDELRIWDVRQDKEFAVIPLDAACLDAAFTPDGGSLAWVETDGVVRLWDLAARTTKTVPLAGRRAVFQAEFSADGGVLVTVSEENDVEVWEMPGGRAVGSFTAEHGVVVEAAPSADGRLLAIGGDDRTIRLWDVAGGALLGTQASGHKLNISSLTFSPTAPILVSGGYDGYVRMWSTADLTPLGEPVPSRTGGVYSAAFSPDGQILACAGIFSTVALWNVERRVLAHPPLATENTDIYQLALSPDGSFLASAGLSYDFSPNSSKAFVNLWRL
ncbi:protein kinase family protein [Actinocorallia aurea]